MRHHSARGALLYNIVSCYLPFGRNPGHLFMHGCAIYRALAVRGLPRQRWAPVKVRRYQTCMRPMCETTGVELTPGDVRADQLFGQTIGSFIYWPCLLTLFVSYLLWIRGVAHVYAIWAFRDSCKLSDKVRIEIIIIFSRFGGQGGRWI